VRAVRNPSGPRFWKGPPQRHGANIDLVRPTYYLSHLELELNSGVGRYASVFHIKELNSANELCTIPAASIASMLTCSTEASRFGTSCLRSATSLWSSPFFSFIRECFGRNSSTTVVSRPVPRLFRGCAARKHDPILRRHSVVTSASRPSVNLAPPIAHDLTGDRLR
jgi:hypothetical protein